MKENVIKAHLVRDNDSITDLLEMIKWAENDGEYLSVKLFSDFSGAVYLTDDFNTGIEIFEFANKEQLYDFLKSR